MADDLVRRSVESLGTTFDVDGNAVVTVGCDCGALTELVLVLLVDANSTPGGEVAYTCDGCLTSRWITFTIRPPASGITEHLGEQR